MRTWMNVAVVVVVAALAALAGCNKKCPDCPPPKDCPASSCPIDASAPDDPYKWTYAKDEKTGNWAMIGLTADQKPIIIPLDPAKTRAFIDGKETTLGDTFLRGPGGCPCQLPACWPYCRPAAEVLGKEPTDFYGGTTGGATGGATGSGAGPGSTLPAPN
jgi:predicted small lipoprotein YifL